MRGCVWVEESFLWNDKWQIKILSEFISSSHSTFYKWLKLKKYPIIGFQNSWMDMRGCVWVGESFLSQDKREVKLLSQFCPTFTNDSNSKNNYLYNFDICNFTNGYWGMCMIGGKFLKEWQVTDKVIEVFFTIHIFILQMTQTQGIITCRVLKIHEWIWGDVHEWGKVS